METEVPYDEGSVLNRLFRSLGPFGFVAVDVNRVNLDDICAEPREGRIIRVDGDPSKCIQFFVSSDENTLGCLAGWISDEA